MREILGIGLVLFCIPLFLPSWKWLASYAAVFLLANAGLYAHHLYIISSDASYGSPGDALGILFFMFFFLCFLIGTTIKALYFFVQKYKKTSKHMQS